MEWNLENNWKEFLFNSSSLRGINGVSSIEMPEAYKKIGKTHGANK